MTSIAVWVIFFFVISYCVRIYYYKTQINFDQIKNKAPLQYSLGHGKINKITESLDCDAHQVYCFTNYDCYDGCNNNSIYSCVKGICMNSRILKYDPPDLNKSCESGLGFLPLLVGSDAMAYWDYNCKSVDPGISEVSVDGGKFHYTNAMCQGESEWLKRVNYDHKYPMPTDCTCKYPVQIPATRTVRARVICADTPQQKLALEKQLQKVK